ncbi:acyl-CoA thioesterase 13 [Ictidomys tridecemlineatus]|nr:acyl-CoA thioesterase 13 [Ictidomys tridecemlineatus]
MDAEEWDEDQEGAPPAPLFQVQNLRLRVVSLPCNAVTALFLVAPPPRASETGSVFLQLAGLQGCRSSVKAVLRLLSPLQRRPTSVVTLVSAAPEKVICEMKVEEQHANKMGTLHGGLTATLIDSISTVALLCSERGLPGVSVDMNITYVYKLPQRPFALINHFKPLRHCL